MTTNRYVTPYYQYSRSDGSPVAGGKLYFYASGTTNIATTYADELHTIQNPNPITLDARGSPGSIFLINVNNYRVQLRDTNNATILFDIDPCIAYKSTI